MAEKSMKVGLLLPFSTWRFYAKKAKQSNTSLPEQLRNVLLEFERLEKEVDADEN